MKATGFLAKTMKLSEGRYEVGLFLLDDQKMTNTYCSAYTQICSSVSRLQKDTNLRQRSKATTQVDLDNNHRRESEIKELNYTRIEPQWYVPHHLVFNANKPGKIRCVGNALSKHKPPATNDQLKSGLTLVQNLVALNLQFREHQFVKTADVEAMFLQIKKPTADFIFLRFLWRNDCNKIVEIREQTRPVSGAKSSFCANHALQEPGIDNKASYPFASQAIKRNFSVDTFAESVATNEETIGL